jgi:hypothetical protein
LGFSQAGCHPIRSTSKAVNFNYGEQTSLHTTDSTTGTRLLFTFMDHRKANQKKLISKNHWECNHNDSPMCIQV